MGIDLTAMTSDDVFAAGGSKAGLVRVYMAERKNIATMPPIDTIVTISDAVTISADPVMGALKYFIEIPLSKDQGELKNIFKAVNPDQTAQEATIDLAFSRMNALTLGFIQNIMEKDIVYIVQQCGQRFILGHDVCNGRVYVEQAEGTTGKSSTDTSNLVYTVRQTGSIAPVFKGTIPLAP